MDTLYNLFAYFYFVYCLFCLFVRLPIAPSKPTNLRFTISEPSKNTRPRVKVTWGAPSEENGIITKYTLTYSYSFGGVTNLAKVSTNSQTFEYAFDVLGGIEYTVSVYAETIKPGPKEEQVQFVPVYGKLKLVTNFIDEPFVISQF